MTNGSLERLKDNLQVLDLSYNEFHDDFSCLGNLKNLVILNLASNSLSGPIPQSFENLTILRELILKDNQLNETIPVFLGQLSTLRVLDLSGNHLDGTIPDSLGKLLKLHVLDLSHNSLEGTLDEIHLRNLSNLQDLRMGFNELAVKLGPNWLPPFQLASLELQSCTIETPFPQWLQTQTKLIKLDLSETGIFGPIPKWFQQMGLIEFHLSSNRISALPENLHDMMPKLSGLSTS
ncbi:hypothetical protein L6164_000887 [Bauhinia variegata]|uniref:Uncharacterized protein n=1 Tax=Bauhinia variegata TaxID=167791 RepID=A0ACB9Q7G7_BAUVA|nr:hypothetical protein L6164_000887 [Bauhinia variegata]